MSEMSPEDAVQYQVSADFPGRHTSTRYRTWRLIAWIFGGVSVLAGFGGLMLVAVIWAIGFLRWFYLQYTGDRRTSRAFSEKLGTGCDGFYRYTCICCEFLVQQG